MTTTARLSAALAAVLVTSAALADPLLEQHLEKAMRANPDIMAARAQAELAKAELNLAQMKVARELVALHSRLEAQYRKIQLIREQSQENPKDRNVVHTLIDAEAQLAETQAQLSYLIGQSAAGLPTGGQPGPAATTASLPRGPIVEKLSKALAKPVTVEFVDTPLEDVGKFLSDLLDIPIVADKSIGTIPVTLNLKGLSLVAATQSMEDICPEVSFVVRDYGILITSSDLAIRKGFVSAADFEKHLADQSHGKNPEPKPESKR